MGNTCSSSVIFRKCKGCGMKTNDSKSKIEKDGFHRSCRKCSECGRGAYYMSDYPIYVNVETGKHVICPNETSPYSSAFIKTDDNLLDIR